MPERPRLAPLDKHFRNIFCIKDKDGTIKTKCFLSLGLTVYDSESNFCNHFSDIINLSCRIENDSRDGPILQE